MKTKYVVTIAAVVFALGFAMHRGMTQSSAAPNAPIIIGSGRAPNVGTPVDPRSLSFYGGYYSGYNTEPSYSAAVSLYNVTFGPEDIPQTSSQITTRRTSTTVSFQWQGEPRAIKSATFSLLDKNNSVISKQVVTSLPVKATLKRTSKASAYSVNIQYINGLTNSVVSPL